MTEKTKKKINEIIRDIKTEASSYHQDRLDQISKLL